MNITNIDKVPNAALNRVEITADISYEGATPKSSDVQSSIAQKVSANQQLIVVKHIYSRFGERAARVLAYQYNDEAQLKAIEPKPKVKKVPTGAEKKE